jgi:hypothetical protein
MWFPLPRPADRSRLRSGLRGPLAAALIACAMLPVACIDNATEPDSFLRLEASSDLMTYERVTIRLGDTLGKHEVTLYDDSLPSMARLGRLPAGPYRGGTVRITILGYLASQVAYREVRLYDGGSQKVLSVDIKRGDSASVDPVLPDTGDGQPVKITKHAPLFASAPWDTLVTPRDSVLLWAEATDEDGDLDGYTWDCNGDGKPEDSAALNGYRAKIRFGKSYADSGTRTCVLKVWDKEGRTAQAKARIQVVLDAPWANAGKDTTVVVGTTIFMHAGGEDGLGAIVSREWRIGSGEFKPMTQMETTLQAPATPGDLVCILRVRDTDSLVAYDTMMVKVVYSPDNTLAELKTSVGVLEPAFRKDIRAYSLSLGASDSLIFFSPRVNEPHAVFGIAGTSASAGASGPLTVPPGETVFTIQVTAQDGSILQYSVTARR